MPPMCMYMANDGVAGDWHYVHYVSRAMGGAGLIIFEATAVSPEGRISLHDLGIWEDEQIPGLKRIVDAIHFAGGKAGIQLAHAGRKADLEGFTPLSSTNIPFSDEYDVPRALDRKEIDGIVEAFGLAAERVMKAGFDFIEIHGAHGYLINQFLSPLVNNRMDIYGGSPENRSRFLKEIIKAIRKQWPLEKPLGVRVSAEEFADGGNRPQDVASLINFVKAEGLDIIHVSSGGVVSSKVESWTGYQIPFAETIKKETGLPVIGGGLITEAQLAEEMVANGRTDLVFLGRELLRNPYWPLLASRELSGDISWPESYERAKK